MRCFHRTNAADAILKEGFRDATGFYGFDLEQSGVWVADRPLDANEGARGNRLLIIELPEDVFREHEYTEEGFPYREAIIPAAVLNRYGPPRECTPEEEEQAPDDRFHPPAPEQSK
jgi:hypothetical protein